MICIVRFFKDIYFHIPLGNTRFGIDLNAQNVIGMTLFDFVGETEIQTHLK